MCECGGEYPSERHDGIIQRARVIDRRRSASSGFRGGRQRFVTFTKRRKNPPFFFLFLFFDSPARQMSKMMMYTEPGPEQIYKQMVKSTELERIASRSTSQSHKKKKERKTKQSYQTTSIRHTHTHTRRVISVQGDLNEI